MATCIRDGWPAQFTHAGPEYYFSTPLLCALLNQHITRPILLHITRVPIMGWLLNYTCSHSYLSLTLGMVPVSVNLCHLATYKYLWPSTVHLLCTVQSYYEESTLYQLNYRSYSSSHMHCLELLQHIAPQIHTYCTSPQ